MNGRSMRSRPLEAILHLAEDVSARQHHFYIGVEHLFAALLIPNDTSITAQALQWEGVTAEEFAGHLWDRAGEGEPHRAWPGYPLTPRTSVVLDIAHEIALESGQPTHERHLIQAIIEESDSIPLLIMQRKGIEPRQFLAAINHPA